jgi:hypothetical protein
MIVLSLILQESSAVERAAGGLTPLSLAFMVVSMTAVTWLAVWCYSRILRGKEHFDPDGTGPAHSPVPGKADPES